MKLDSATILFRTGRCFYLAIPLLAAACAVSDHALGSDQMLAEDGGIISAECREGATRSCRCGEEEGQALCRRAAWSLCECSTHDGGRTRADAGKSGQPACKVGYYEGEFSGRYRPGLFGLGVLGSGLPFDITGGPMGARPGLSFTLEETSTGAAGEFSTFTVGNGCMTGIAKAVGTDNPFVAKLTGDLDCGTGLFVGILDGYYRLLNVPGANFKFSGPITAQFDVDQLRLRDGEWSVMEPPALNGDPAGGGDGTWSATYQAPKPTGDNPCRDLPAGDAGVGDGGDVRTTAGRSASN